MAIELYFQDRSLGLAGFLRKARKATRCGAHAERLSEVCGARGRVIEAGMLYVESTDGIDAFHPDRFCVDCAPAEGFVLPVEVRS